MGQAIVKLDAAKLTLASLLFYNCATGRSHPCTALTNLLTSQPHRPEIKTNPPSPGKSSTGHAQRATVAAPFPNMRTQFSAIISFQATKQSQLSVAAGDQLWAEMKSPRLDRGGWVWSYSSRLDKMGFVPAWCLQLCER